MSVERDTEIMLSAVGINPANGWTVQSFFASDSGAVTVKHPARGLAFFVAADSKSSTWNLGLNLVEQVKDLILLQFATGAMKMTHYEKEAE